MKKKKKYRILKNVHITEYYATREAKSTEENKILMDSSYRILG